MSLNNSKNSPTALLVLGIIVIGSNAFVLSPILSDVARALDTTSVVIARVISAYGGATAISAFLFSGWIDRFGVKPVLVIAAAVMATALGFSAASQSWEMLAVSQGVVGLTAGVMLPAIYTAATALAPKGGGARALGLVLNGWAISLVAGVPAAALVTQYLGWRYAYAALSLLAAAVLLGFLWLQMPKPVSRQAMISPLKAAAIPGVPKLLLIGLTYMSAFYGTYAFLGDHLRMTLGLSTGQAGMVVLAYGAGFGLAGFGNTLLDRLGPARIFPFVLAIIAVIYMVMLPATTTFFWSMLIALIWGVANHYGLNILVLLLSQQRPEARGAILGLHSTVTYTAVFAGPLVLGALYSDYGFPAVVTAASVFVAVGAILASQRVGWYGRSQPGV